MPPDNTDVQAKFRPFYSIVGDYYYRMYFDLDKLPDGAVGWAGPETGNVGLKPLSCRPGADISHLHMRNP